jgi:hypothetical protein
LPNTLRSQLSHEIDGLRLAFDGMVSDDLAFAISSSHGWCWDRETTELDTESDRSKSPLSVRFIMLAVVVEFGWLRTRRGIFNEASQTCCRPHAGAWIQIVGLVALEGLAQANRVPHEIFAAPQRARHPYCMFHLNHLSAESASL